MSSPQREAIESRPMVFLVPLVALAVLVTSGIAAWRIAPRVRELDWLRGIGPADAASPAEGPALYRGKLRGPPGRVTPSGRVAAAFWWAVVTRDDDGSTVFCQGRERSNLWLETSAGTLRLAFTDTAPEFVGLVTDEKDDEYDRRIGIDLGSTRRTIDVTPPSGTCTHDGASYEESLIGDGAEVEVAGCLKDGAIGECSGPLTAVLSVPTLETHRRHRMEDALDTFRFALILCIIALLMAGPLAVVAARAAVRTLRPGEGP